MGNSAGISGKKAKATTKKSTRKKSRRSKTIRRIVKFDLSGALNNADHGTVEDVTVDPHCGLWLNCRCIDKEIQLGGDLFQIHIPIDERTAKTAGAKSVDLKNGDSIQMSYTLSLGANGEVGVYPKEDGENKTPSRPGTDDPVNHPKHYTFGKFEVIDVLMDWFSGDPLLWQVGKYIARAGHKGNRLQDLEKAEWYLKRRIEIAKAEAKK